MTEIACHRCHILFEPVQYTDGTVDESDRLCIDCVEAGEEDDEEAPMINNYPKMTRLARTFPLFNPERPAKSSHVEPFDAEKLAEDACAWSHGERCAVQFLLEVYHPGLEWPCGSFNVMEAFGVWDDRYRAAFLAWAKDPWWA